MMRATATLVAELDGDRTVLTTCRSEPPLLLRRTGTTGAIAEVYLVGGAAGPLGGDQLHLNVTVGIGARLVIRTVAVSVALPGATDDWSRFQIKAVVAGGTLAWLPQPVLAAHGCRHRTHADVAVLDGGRLTWRDELAWGRSGEEGGDVVTALTVRFAGRELLAQDLALGPSAPGWDGPAVLGGARSAGSIVLVHPRLVGVDYPMAVDLPPQSAVLPLAGPGVLLTAVAPDALTLHRRLSVLAALIPVTKNDVLYE